MQYAKCNELTVQYAKCIFLLSNKFSQTCSGSKIKQQKIFLFKMSHQRIKISKTLVHPELTNISSQILAFPSPM